MAQKNPASAAMTRWMITEVLDRNPAERTLDDSVLTYLNASPQQQQVIDTTISAVIASCEGGDYVKDSAGFREVIAQVGMAESDKMQKLAIEIGQNGEKIKAFVKAQEEGNRNMQLSHALTLEIEHRILYGVPSAPAKYDLKGADTRSFPVNIHALKLEMKNQTTGADKALHDANELLESFTFVSFKSNQLAETLQRYARELQAGRPAGKSPDGSGKPGPA